MPTSETTQKRRLREPCSDCPVRDAVWRLNAGRSPLNPASWPGWGKVIIVSSAAALFSVLVSGFFLWAPRAHSTPIQPPAVAGMSQGVLDVRICPGCGNHIVLRDSRFCRFCGARLLEN